jgi:hypothetical protein
MTEVALALVVVAIIACNVAFLLMGLLTGGRKELRRYVAVAAILMIAAVSLSVWQKGPGELIGLSPMLAWLVGIAAGELRARLK